MKHFIPPCSFNCPVHTDVPAYVDCIVRGEYRKAYQIIRERNPFPAVCAWVCPHPCEENCRRGNVDEAINIRGLKRFAVEQGSSDWQAGDYEYPVFDKNNIPGGDVAVIGAGPSGLAAAHELASRGLSVSVLDKHEEPGGHLYASLPLYRLPREVVRRDVSALVQPGIKIYCGVEAGKDVSLEQLRQKYRAVIVAAGLQQSKQLPVPGADNPGVISALHFLQRANAGNPVPVGEKVVVVGGGDVAMDVARTALRQGAKASLVCLEPENEMPANRWEIDEALEEGVVMYPGWGPREVVTGDNNQVAGLNLRKVTSVFDDDGKFNPNYDENVTEFIPGDSIIVAIGQAPSLDFARESLQLDNRGNLVVNRGTMTAGEGVFACGEVANGPGSAIAAIASGRQVAANVAAYLAGKDYPIPANNFTVLDKLAPDLAGSIPDQERLALPQLDPGARKFSFEEFEKGFSRENAAAEASRCLRCGMGPEVDTSKCIACLTCQRVCPFGVPAVESKAYISPDTCQACGICAAACPARAITIPGTGDEQEAVPDSAFKIYVCRRALGQKLEPGFYKEIPGLEKAAVTVVPCVGALDAGKLLGDLEQGYRGVAMVACAERCTSQGAAGYRDAEIKTARAICDQAGVDGKRLALFSSASRSYLQAALAEFSRYIEQV